MKGYIDYKLMRYIVIGLVLVYVTFQFAPPYAKYFQLKYYIVDQVGWFHNLGERKVRRNIVEYAERKELDIINEDISMVIIPGKIEISLDYEVEVRHPWGKSTWLYFNPSVVQRTD